MRKIPKPEKLFSPQVLEQLQMALEEIGEIEPWFDAECQEWVFEHPAYPESYSGATPEEVIRGYPLYLGQLIQARLDGSLAPYVEKKITGRAGRRPRVGRSQRVTKPSTRMVRLPVEIAEWLKADPENVNQVRKLMKAS